MRRSVATVITLVAAFAGAACEDGPSQTYSVAPANAGSVWNGPPGGGGVVTDGGTFVSPATQSFDAQVGGQNANLLCTAAQQKAVWTANFSAPIAPPGLGGGLDLAGGPPGSNGIWGYNPNCLNYNNCSSNAPATYGTYDPTKESWQGETVEQAQQLLCQAALSGAGSNLFGETNAVAWGENGELAVDFNLNSRILQDLIFGIGYAGTLTGTNSKTKTTYTVTMDNTEMKKSVNGGMPSLVTVNWTDGSNTALANDMYEAFRQTFLPAFPADQECVSAGHCIIDNNGINDGIFFFTPLNLAIFVATTVGTPQANSTPLLVQVGLLKVLPFSGASVLMKLDLAGEGPLAIQTGLGSTGATRTCKYHLGMKYGDPGMADPDSFQYDCVQPFSASGDLNFNKIAQAQLLGAIAHGDEDYEFNILGVDPQFAAASLNPHEVVADGQNPQAGDLSYQLGIDQYVLGPIANDYTNNDTTKAKDWHGIGLITLEWANLVQQYMRANAGVTSELGDPACIANPLRPQAASGGMDAGAGDAAKDAVVADTGSGGGGGKICSGLEGIVTSAPPALAPAYMAPNALGPAAMSVNYAGNCNATDVQSGKCQKNQLGVGLKPGTWYSLFCSDAGGLDSNGVPVGYKQCAGGTAVGSNTYQGYFFDTMQAAVAASYGNLTIPESLASRRFYFQQWLLAVVKYLQTADAPNTPLLAPTGMPAIDNNVVDPNNLYFDTLGGGFEFGKYVFNNAVNTATGDPTANYPTSIEVGTNLLTSVVNNFTFTRYAFRGETALYDALKTSASDKPGAEPVFVTNLTGAPALVAAYGTYACAVNQSSRSCGGTLGPVDPVSGKPLYAPYKDAFGQSFLNIAAYGVPPQASAMTVDPGNPYTLIQSALVTVPVLANPFDQTSAPTSSSPITELLPYLNGATVGFPVTIDGSRDKFYNTQNIDFTGDTVSASVDYEYEATVGADGGVGTPALVIRAVETQHYLGLVFACVEPNAATGAKDVLGIRMYENGVDILNWIKAHTYGPYNPVVDCGIQFKYSIYGNYADYITFGVSPGQSLHGVRLGFNPGYGGSVVTDVTIFDPNIVASLGQ